VEKEVYTEAYRIGDPIGWRSWRNDKALAACADTRDEEAWTEWAGSAESWYLDGCFDGVMGRGSKYEK
jgi:hypothetical protein